MLKREETLYIVLCSLNTGHSGGYKSQFEKEMECEHTWTHPHIEWGEEEFTVYSTQPLAFQMFNYSF